jgi:hypothetical protein
LTLRDVEGLAEQYVARLRDYKRERIAGMFGVL